VDATYIDVVCLKDIEMLDPAFKTLPEADHVLYTIQNISVPIKSADDRTIATLQVEAYSKKLHHHKNDLEHM
jgi:hypothetical protein